MSHILYTSRPLSGNDFVIRPLFDQGAVPLLPEDDDRVFDPALDSVSHMPEVVSRLSKMAQKSFSKPRNITTMLMIKGFDSDRYRVPYEFAAFSEFIQKAVNEEHRRTKNAFHRAVVLKISSPHPGGEKWHFDVKPETKGAVRTYCCADQLPTRYAKVRFDHARVPFAYSSDRAYEFMIAASGFKRGDDTIEAESYFQAKPYDIVRHNGMTVHRGFGAENRTLATLIYCGR